MPSLTTAERAELEQLREFASKSLMSPLDRAFFDLQKIIDHYPESSAIRVLATAINELKRSIKE